MEDEKKLEENIQKLDEDLKKLYDKIKKEKIPEKQREKKSLYQSFNILNASRIREIQMEKLILNKKNR